MKIFTVVVTHNRTELLRRALTSILNQTRKSDFVIVVSNSTVPNQVIEKELCGKLDFYYCQNLRTNNYAGALNTGIEYFITNNDIEDNIYFSSLDDDDEWKENYLETVAAQGAHYDVILSNIIRDNGVEKIKLHLPTTLDYHSFLSGNPGVGGSNTFVRLKTLLKAGAFDESMNATVDRDVFVRLFQLNPSYKIINEHLVLLYVEKNRDRVTTNTALKRSSYRYFYYKYQYIMDTADKEQFFSRASSLFKLEKKEIAVDFSKETAIKESEITFSETIDFQFIIGFIAGDQTIALRIINTIIHRKIKIAKLIIIDNLPNADNFDEERKLLDRYHIKFKIVNKSEWRKNLPNGYYGTYFKKYDKIDSIPIGRTILQHHLFTETSNFEKPVFWIIDDDVSFTNTFEHHRTDGEVDLFKLINENINDCDALIGSVSKDPPLPFLSTIRTQLIDLCFSSKKANAHSSDYLNISALKDYYYDITDAHFNHLETPLYYPSNLQSDLKYIFSGKAVSRPCLQREVKGTHRLVSNRGPNTLVFNRDLLRFYPVVNMEVNNKFVRRGDLLWALLNQLISERKIIDHTFCIDQNRPLAAFNIEKELDKSANDIIGYAFNKAIIQTIGVIKTQTNPNRPKDIYEALNAPIFFNQFVATYFFFLSKRSARFLMNYYRIIGLLGEINNKQDTAKYSNQFSDKTLKKYFIDTVSKSRDEKSLKQFLENLSAAVWTYESSIKKIIETKSINKARIIETFKLNTELTFLGEGSEGIVFTDKQFVYKSFFSMKDYEWQFLKKIGRVFPNSSFFEKLDFVEHKNRFYIKYPYHTFKNFNTINKEQLIEFLRFCKKNQFVFSNIKPTNFILIKDNQLKLIDYGRSFEPYTGEKFINMTKRAFLMLNNPEMPETAFRQLTQEINNGKIPSEISGWNQFFNEVI